MNIKSFFLFTFALMFACLSATAFETGQTIRLVNRGKSVFVENSSLDANKYAVLWTETNVNAQRWTLEMKTNGTFLLSNDYTGYYLASLSTATSGNIGQTNKSTANSRGSWEFVQIEGTTNQYNIYLGTTRRFALAAADEASEGSKLSLVDVTKTTDINPERIAWTAEVVNQMAKEFTKDKRDDMMNKWKARAYRQAGTGWIIGNGGWWGDAEMFEIVLDALETTGDQQYATMFDNLYRNFISRNQSTWYQKGVNGYNEYNDDIAWMCIACVRAYLLTGKQDYLTTSKKNFDGMFARADCYGNDLLQWKHNSGQGTNSCINGPAAVCACYLAIAEADDSYYEKARKTYIAERGKLFEMSNGKPTGKIWDSYDQGTGNYNYWASTYNQGTNLGAAIMLYNHYGDQMFKTDADAIIKWSEANLANSYGIINACQTVRGDLTGFKGIMLRYIRMYAETFDKPEHYAWLAKNAYHAWNNRNSSGITSSAWLTKSEENFKHLEGSEEKEFGHDGNMTCVSAAFNCHLGVVDSHDAYVMNEAEDFNFVRNAPVTYTGGTDDGGGMVGPMSNGHYIGYRRVDFGDSPASHIDMRVKINANATKINVFLDQPNATGGVLLCSVMGSELSSTSTWGTIRKIINQPVTGVHDIYFVSSGNGQTNINWWQFQRLNSIYADLTNGKGTVTASFTTDDVSALIDDDPSTAVTADIQSTTNNWIMYHNDTAMQIYGYQVFSGDTDGGDPKGWTLQASNTGRTWVTLQTVSDITFSAHGERYNSDIQVSRAYKYYRLLFSCRDGQTKLSVSEWQLLGRCIETSDLTNDGGTITEGCESLIDHEGNTAVQTPVTVVYHANGIYKLTGYSITASSAEQAPKSWKVEASTNGSSWSLINEQSEALFPYDNYTFVCRVNNSTSYQYYRLTIAGEGAQLTQWQLFGNQDFGTFYADVTKIATVLACDGSETAQLTDDNGATYSILNGEPGLYWEIFTPLPIKPLGFSIISANDASLDPNKVVLCGYDDNGNATQLSNKTPTFTARGSRLTYTTSSTKLFKRFALFAGDANTTSVRLADFELYGSVIADATDPNILTPASVDASAVGLSNTELIGRINDGNRTYHYRASFTEPISITYTYDEPVIINTYGISASKSEVTRDPAAWTLEGSNNGNTWTQIDSRSNELFSQRYATQFYAVDATTAYKYYRLTVTATNGADQLQIGELQFFNLQPEQLDPTGIVTPVETAERETGIYNLAGQRLQKLQKGINIVNGRKVAVK